MLVPLTAKAEIFEPESSLANVDTISFWQASDGTIQLQPHRLPFVPDSVIDNETLWLARCIFSETKRPEEQELIAWVVRNRVEIGYRGKTSYKEVVLDPFQFSAFNSESPEAPYYSSLALQHDESGWQRALSIAYYVRHARPQYRPFSAETLHFYSQQSMIGRREPVWARGLTPIRPPEHYRLDERRFRFFEGIS
ncbi:MAG: cell wall hydrolase [Rhodothermales bacterium]